MMQEPARWQRRGRQKWLSFCRWRFFWSLSDADGQQWWGLGGAL